MWTLEYAVLTHFVDFSDFLVDFGLYLAECNLHELGVVCFDLQNQSLDAFVQ